MLSHDKTVALLIVGLSLAGLAARGSAGNTPQNKPIAEGVLLRAVDGKLWSSEMGSLLFEFGADVNQVGAAVSAGTKLRLLPCNTLERLAADPALARASAEPGGNDRPARPVRLWAMVTQYKGENYLFATYYLPLRKAQAGRSDVKTRPTELAGDVKPGTAEPNDEIGIPAEIIAILGRDKTRTQNTERRTQNIRETRTASNSQNRVLVDEVGFVKQDKAGARFVPDAVGRNVSRRSFELLPCRALELAERESGSRRVLSEPIRFAIAGLVTQYKGTEYLLLQRATRVYSHGNFTN